jgi:hypothetical protein
VSRRGSFSEICVTFPVNLVADTSSTGLSDGGLHAPITTDHAPLHVNHRSSDANVNHCVNEHHYFKPCP